MRLERPAAVVLKSWNLQKVKVAALDLTKGCVSLNRFSAESVTDKIWICSFAKYHDSCTNASREIRTGENEKERARDSLLGVKKPTPVASFSFADSSLRM